MYKFIKTESEGLSDITEVLIQTKHHDVTVEELCGMFKSFLQACNFSIDYDEEIDVVKMPSETCEGEMETIELDLSDSEFNKLATMAHEQDITFNQLVNNILREKFGMLEANGKMDDLIAALQEQDLDIESEQLNKEAADEEFQFVVDALKQQDVNNMDEINRQLSDAAEEEKVEAIQLDLFDDTDNKILLNEERKVQPEVLNQALDSVEKETVETITNQPDSVEIHTIDIVGKTPDEVEKEYFEKIDVEVRPTLMPIEINKEKP